MIPHPAPREGSADDLEPFDVIELDGEHWAILSEPEQCPLFPSLPADILVQAFQPASAHPERVYTLSLPLLSSVWTVGRLVPPLPTTTAATLRLPGMRTPSAAT